MPEYLRARGKRYPLASVLAIAVAARLAGYRGVTAFARLAALLSQEWLKAVGAFFSPSKRRHTAPSITTFHNILADLPPETLDEAIGRWTAQQAGTDAPLAMDGKDIRGASKQTGDGRRMMVAAVEHGTGMVLGQAGVERKGNEIPAVRRLSSDLDVTGRVVTLDAMHAQHAPAHETIEKGHSRIERGREIARAGERSLEVTWCLTSLGSERAGPEELLELVRNHWVIENRLRYVRDFIYDEDRCRAHVRNLPRNLSCLTNAAIAIVRCDGRFSYMPEANRHYAARAQEAHEAIMVPPGA